MMNISHPVVNQGTSFQQHLRNGQMTFLHSFRQGRPHLIVTGVDCSTGLAEKQQEYSHINLQIHWPSNYCSWQIIN